MPASPEQPGLFTIEDLPRNERGLTAGEQSQLAESIAAAAQPVEYPPDATDRWLEETGGGPRRASAAMDPPRSKTTHTPRRTGHVRDFTTDSDVDPNWSGPFTGQLPADEEHSDLDDGPVIGLRGSRIAAVTAGLNARRHANEGLPKLYKTARELAAAQKAAPKPIDNNDAS